MTRVRTGQIISVSIAALLAWQSPAFAPDFNVPKIPKGGIKLPEFHLPEIHVPEVHVPGHIDVPSVHAPEIHAPDVHVDVPNLHLPEHLDLGGIHLPEAHIEAPHLNAGNIDSPHLNYGQLPGESPRLPEGNYQALPNNALPNNAPPIYDAAHLPLDTPNAPALNYGALPAEPGNYQALPTNAQHLYDKVELPKEPLRYGSLAPELPDRPLAGVGHYQPVPKLPEHLQGLPSPKALATGVPEVAPAIRKGLKTSTKVVIGATVTMVGLTVVGISLPSVVKKITGDDLPDTGNATVDSAVDALTPP